MKQKTQLTPFHVTRDDLLSPMWLRLTQHLDAEISRLRECNDNKNNDHATTQFYRGQIHALKQLKSLKSAGSQDPEL